MDAILDYFSMHFGRAFWRVVALAEKMQKQRGLETPFFGLYFVLLCSSFFQVF